MLFFAADLLRRLRPLAGGLRPGETCLPEGQMGIGLTGRQSDHYFCLFCRWQKKLLGHFKKINFSSVFHSKAANVSKYSSKRVFSCDLVRARATFCRNSPEAGNPRVRTNKVRRKAFICAGP